MPAENAAPVENAVPVEIPTVTIRSRDGAYVLALGETPQLDRIHQLHEAAMSVSQMGAPVVVDCAGVEHLGAWAIQILLALEQVLVSTGGRLGIVGASPQIRNYLSLAGVSEHFPAVSEEEKRGQDRADRG